MPIVRTFLCVLLLAALCHAIKPRHYHKTRLGIHGEHLMHKTKKTISSTQYNPLFFTQTLDHFNGNEITNWQQQYFVNDTFFRGGHSPVFLCVGGEGPPLDPTVVIDGGLHCGWMIILAQKHHALILALEHRFYGISVPTADYSTKNLRFLSSEQALADIASFHTFVSTQYKLGTHNKWFTFGGSYPGMLAGWARLKYPHLIHASVSSSSPVLAQTNFQGYNDVVTASMSAPIVGGSLACSQQIQQAFQSLGTLLMDGDGRLQLAQQFNVCSADSLDLWNNQADFTEDLAGVFGVQENDPSCTEFACNISSWCQIMQDETRGASPLDRLAFLVNYFSGEECLYLNHTDEIVQLQNTSLAVGQDRSWMYQTCAEFAFFQTCDPKSQCIFTSSPHYNNLQSSYDLCKTIFGIPGNVTSQRVQFTNEQYGGNHPAGSRILFVNGQIDPWHYLSVLKDLPHEPALWVEGASHHAWTHTPAPTDTPEVWAARYKIADYVAAWLIE